MSRDDVSRVAWTFAALAVTGNTVEVFTDLDGWLWTGARFTVSVVFTIAVILWVLMTVRARRSARRN